MMQRLLDWESRLAEAIDKHRALPFEWGVSDCLELSMDAVVAMTSETSVCAEIRHHYKTEAGGARCLRRLGCVDAGELLAKNFADEIHPAFAGRGDLVTIKSEDKIAIGICLGAVLVGKAPSGLTFVPRSVAVRAFRI